MYGIYTFVDDQGVNTHIDSQALRKWCLEQAIINKLEVFMCPIDYEVAKRFLIDNIIDPKRVAHLMIRRNLDPIIYCKDGTFSPKNGGPNVMLVDGHHRYYLQYKCGATHIPGFCLEVEQWKPFQLYGLPTVTAEQLKAAPVTKRDY
jgi:hypothetical protein